MISPDRVAAIEAAIRNSDTAKIKLLLRAGVPVNYVFADVAKKSLLGMAAATGQYPSFLILAEAGADLMYDGAYFGTILEESVAFPTASLEILEWLLQNAEFGPDAKSNALAHAASKADSRFCAALLAAGADPNWEGKYATTPLMYAVAANDEENALALLRAGGDASRKFPKTEDEQTSRKSVAEAAMAKGMSQLLSEIGAKPGKPSSQPAAKKETVEALTAKFGEFLSESKNELPKPFTAEPPDFYRQSAASDYLRFLRTHDGSGELDVIPMPTDISYRLLSLEDSIAIRDEVRDVCKGEVTAGLATEWWNDEWIPIAQNGGGDYLVIDGSNGHILIFSHESRTTSMRSKTFQDLISEIVAGLENSLYKYDASEKAIL